MEEIKDFSELMNWVHKCYSHLAKMFYQREQMHIALHPITWYKIVSYIHSSSNVVQSEEIIKINSIPVTVSPNNDINSCEFEIKDWKQSYNLKNEANPKPPTFVADITILNQTQWQA